MLFESRDISISTHWRDFSETWIMKTNIRSVLTLLAFLCLPVAGPQAQAVVPPPDGGYPNFTTAEGTNALKSLTTGAANTAVGWYSLFANTTASFNTATGAGALLFNTADSNTAFGTAALLFNTTGGTPSGSGDSEEGPNTALGALALNQSIVASSNTAVGFQALGATQTGGFSTAVGFKALTNSTTQSNDAFGYKALGNNTIGFGNVAIGDVALFNNTGGSTNVALGNRAGFQSTGDNNVYIGYNMQGDSGESDACYIRSIFGQTSVAGTAVLINADNKLGTLTSSKRFKEDIKPMDKASDALFGLEPVTFRYKKAIDPAGKSQFGLVAEEVDKINPDLVVRDKEGKPYSVRYEAVNAMLLNEFLKEHRKVEKLEATIAALAAQVDKVAAQVQINKPAMRVAVENR
jgi:hypothetical protein